MKSDDVHMIQALAKEIREEIQALKYEVLQIKSKLNITRQMVANYYEECKGRKE